MSFPGISSILILISLVQSSNAQVIVRHRPVSRIIAGCVVGGVFAIFFLCLFCFLLSRRRNIRWKSRFNRGVPSTQQPQAVAYIPENQRAGYNPQTTAPLAQPQPSYLNQNMGSPVSSQQSFSQQSYPQQTYPQQRTSTPPAPPAYGQEANYDRQYAPPAGPPPPPVTQEYKTSYPSLGVAPPPVAHTAG